MAGTMTQVTGAVVDTSDQLMMFELLQKAFVVNGSTLGVVDFVNTKLDLGAGNELTTAPSKGAVLTQATSGAVMVVDFVDSTKRYIYGYTTNGTFNATNTVSSDDGGEPEAEMSPASFTPAAVAEATDMPHWYTWTKGPNNTVAIVTKAYLGCRYNGRAVLAGDPNKPHQWYMSRQGDPWNWDYAGGDAQSAVSGQDTDAGVIGDIIRALIPYHDDYLVFGCANSLYWLQGDPTAGGSIATVTDATGIYGSASWCWTDGGVLYFWGTNGIYKWFPGQEPRCVSQQNLPLLIKDEAADPSTHRITMGWDKNRRGVTIAITKLADGTNSNYFMALEFESDEYGAALFPETYPTECGVYAMHHYDANDPDDAGLLLGCTDGYIRVFDDDAKDDDKGNTDQAISSNVVIGPIPLSSDPTHEGTISSPEVELGGGAADGSQPDSDNATLQVFTSVSAEKLVEDIADGDPPRFAATIAGPGGRHGKLRARTASGRFACLKLLNSTAAQSWSLERILAYMTPSKRRGK